MKKVGIAFRFYESTIAALSSISESSKISRTDIVGLMILHGQHDPSMRHPAPVGKKRMVSFRVSEKNAKLLQKKAQSVHLTSTSLLELFIHNLGVKVELKIQ